MGVVNTQVIDSCRSILRIGGLMVITGSLVMVSWFSGLMVLCDRRLYLLFTNRKHCTCTAGSWQSPSFFTRPPTPQDMIQAPKNIQWCSICSRPRYCTYDKSSWRPVTVWHYNDVYNSGLSTDRPSVRFTLAWELNATNLGIHWIRFHDRRTHTIGDNLFVCCLYCWLAYVDFQQKQPVKCSSHTYIIIPTDPYAVEYVLPIKIFKACIVRIGIGWTSLQIIRFTFWNMLYWVWLL